MEVEGIWISLIILAIFNRATGMVINESLLFLVIIDLEEYYIATKIPFANMNIWYFT